MKKLKRIFAVFFAFYWLLVFWAAVGRPDPRPFLHNPHHRVAASR